MGKREGVGRREEGGEKRGKWEETSRGCRKVSKN